MISGTHMSSVIVAGGGISASSAAAAIKRRIPSLEVSLVITPVPDDALADRLISTLPSIRNFHADIGLSDEDTIVRAQSGLRLGTLFDGWRQGLPPYVHAYGPYGAPIGGIPFHELWLRDRRRFKLGPFDSFSPAALLARAGATALSPSKSPAFGLQLTPERYSKLIRDYAIHVGVREYPAAIADVRLRPADGFIDGLLLEDGQEIRADLYVDATGPEAVLYERLESEFIEWRQWLPCDRLLMSDGPPEPDAITMDRARAHSIGWSWNASSPTSSSSGLVYSSAHATEERIASAKKNMSEPIALRQGRRRELWVRNCVAIGDAAVLVEPLEWTNLHLVHSQVDRIVAMMPGADCAPIELAEFNRECAAEADRIRDFICLHYHCSARTEPFWKDAAALAPPVSLAHTLEQFQERGRLPFYEEETFARDSWLAVLFGQGIEPRRADPLTDLVLPEEAEPALRSMRQALERSAALLPASPLIDLNPRGAR